MQVWRIALACAMVVFGTSSTSAAVAAQSRDQDAAVNTIRSVLSRSEIGVVVRELTDEELAKSKVKPAGGVYVQSVREGSPAARAAIRAGDIIVSIDGERVRGVRHFARLVAESPAGRQVQAEIIRDGTRQTVAVTPEMSDRLALLPELREELERGIRRLPRDFEFQLPRVSRMRLGVSLTPLTDQLAAYFGVKEGVLVSSVEPGSPASQGGLRAGDVITAIDGRAVRFQADVMAALRSASPGSSLEIRVVRDKQEMTVTITLPTRSRQDGMRQIPI